jgi:hypothetical protein
VIPFHSIPSLLTYDSSQKPFLSSPLAVLSSLTPLISQSLVPFEDWISTISYLIAKSSQEESRQQTQLHWTIHSICMACSSPYHVRSLVGEGILGYWERVLRSKRKGLATCILHNEDGSIEKKERYRWNKDGLEDRDVIVTAISKSISHLTSIDRDLIPKIPFVILS